MRIRSLLSLSHATVTLFFIFSFLFIFFYLTRPPRVLGEPHLLDALTRTLRTTEDSRQIKLKLRELGFEDHFELDLFDRDGNHRRLWGEPTILDPPSFMKETLRGGLFSERDHRMGRHIEWVAVDINGPNSHVLRMSAPGGRPQFFSQVRANLLLALSVSFLAVLAVVLSLSRALAEPIRKLAEVVEQFGRDGFEIRTSVEGPAELRELGSSFNKMASFIEDNTKELRAQKELAERTEALRREFLSDVSHNLRTPLTAVMGWNDALIDGVADDEESYRLRIRRELVHITRIVQRLLELSRWERAAPVLKLESVPLTELLMEVAENLQEAAEAAEVTLEFVGLKPDLQVEVDRQKARDILQILLENIVAHAGSGVHAVVSIETEGERVKLVVEDDGQGFPDTFAGESDLERGASEVGKACLGLAIASRLVKAHGGQLSLSNGTRGGAVAQFTLSQPAD